MTNDKREIVMQLIAAQITRVGLNSVGSNEVRTAVEIAEIIMRHCPDYTSQSRGPG